MLSGPVRVSPKFTMVGTRRSSFWICAPPREGFGALSATYRARTCWMATSISSMRPSRWEYHLRPHHHTPERRRNLDQHSVPRPTSFRKTGLTRRRTIFSFAQPLRRLRTLRPGSSINWGRTKTRFRPRYTAPTARDRHQNRSFFQFESQTFCALLTGSPHVFPQPLDQRTELESARGNAILSRSISRMPSCPTPTRSRPP